MTRYYPTPRILTHSNSISNSNSSLAAPPPEAAVNVESDLVVILAALLCALICVVGFMAVARCAWLRCSTSGVNPNNPSQSLQASANKGLKKNIIQSLPRFTYTTTTTATNSDISDTKFGPSECAICLGEFVEGDEMRVLPQCEHVFHVGCVDTWLGSHSSCPSCRQILVVAGCDHKSRNFHKCLCLH